MKTHTRQRYLQIKKKKKKETHFGYSPGNKSRHPPHSLRCALRLHCYKSSDPPVTTPDDWRHAGQPRHLKLRKSAKHSGNIWQVTRFLSLVIVGTKREKNKWWGEGNKMWWKEKKNDLKKGEKSAEGTSEGERHRERHREGEMSSTRTNSAVFTHSHSQVEVEQEQEEQEEQEEKQQQQQKERKIKKTPRINKRHYQLCYKRKEV